MEKARATGLFFEKMFNEHAVPALLMLTTSNSKSKWHVIYETTKCSSNAQTFIDWLVKRSHSCVRRSYRRLNCLHTAKQYTNSTCTIEEDEERQWESFLFSLSKKVKCKIRNVLNYTKIICITFVLSCSRVRAVLMLRESYILLFGWGVLILCSLCY